MNFTEIIKQVEENPYSGFFYTPVIYKKAVSILFNKPYEAISVYQKDEVEYAFKQAQKLIDKGFYGYTLINYEAGFLFEKKLSTLISSEDEKLIQFFFFTKNETIKIKSSKIILNEFNEEKYSISGFQLNRSKSQFTEDIKKIKHYIKEGDTYQVNYTVKGQFKFSGSYSSFFQKLLFNQSAKYSAFINNKDDFIISLSPELFFHTKGKNIVSHPMKGTSRRSNSIQSDLVAESELKTSEKNLAENVMIVDLIRNNLGRICRYGSVRVPELFRIEKYESLFQMVSEVQGVLKKKITIKDIVENIFPCGSVTGAPKIRTMEIIKEIEKNKRDIYTGSIGLITPKEIKMNVAIRTIKINKETRNGVMGLGSGIVWDSDPINEYEEVILKSKFLTEPLDYFEIFETMKFENGEIKFLDEHLHRMKSAASYFLFKFSKKKIRKELQNKISELDSSQAKKIRLSLNKWGILKFDLSDIPIIKKNIKIIISPNKINSSDNFRRFKTTNRKMYDEEYEKYNSKGFYEIIYLNEKNEITEGSRTNIFLNDGNIWSTPSLDSGALPGIFRQQFIHQCPETLEKILRVEDLFNAKELLLTNAIRGKLNVNKVYISSDEFIAYEK